MTVDRKPIRPEFSNFLIPEFSLDLQPKMVVVAQLVRALDCGSRGRGFEPRHPPIFSFFVKVLFRFQHLFPLTIF